MSNPTPSTTKAASSQKLAAIDAVRGYAVLLVIISHVGGRMPELAFPLTKLSNMGWYGVQLFFIASAVTLMMSWYRSKEKPLKTRLIQFFKRRYFRIAPMYYLAALIYFFLRPPGDQFSLEFLIANLAFLNAWEPNWMPVTPVWQVVPGGWSIGVEFSFYAIFPLLATVCSNIQRSQILVVITLILMLATKKIAQIAYPALDEKYLNNFAYFWLPNQLIIFSLGFVAYWIISAPNGFWLKLREWLGIRVILVFVVAILVVLLLGELGFSNKFVTPHFPWIPTHLLMGVLFALAVIALIENPIAILSTPIVRKIGQYSFSGYCLHFGVIDVLPALSFGYIDVNATGITSIFHFSLFLLGTILVTFLVSALTFRIIEAPFIRLGNFQLRSLRKA